MEEYGKILIIAMPIFLGLIIFEKLYGILRKKDTAPLMDTVSSVSSGMTNVLKDVLGLSFSILTYEFLYNKLHLFELEINVFSIIIGFIVIDFYGYWTHRWAHQINIFWNKHAIHHSSEEFNLGCALRQSISSFVNLFAFLLIPAAILGVSPKLIATIIPIHLFLQFWYHTMHIKKMGFLEKIIVTPSHHRVHHAINPIYIDKNHSQIFIIWDKLFGTFQEELEDVPPVFGITRPASTWNPIKINFQHLWLLIQDAFRSDSWKDKFTIWFKPTGWRPENFEEKYPVNKIEDVYHFEKYGKQNDPILTTWSIIQALTTLFFISYLFNFIATIGVKNMYLYGIFIFMTVYSYTELMDKNPKAYIYEILRFLFAFYLIYINNDWFGIDKFNGIATFCIEIYLVISLIISIKFSFKKTN